MKQSAHLTDNSRPATLFQRAKRFARTVFPCAGPILRATMRAAAAVATLPVILPAAALLWLLEPFHRVRICHLGSVTSIGALAVFPDYYLRQWRRQGRPANTTFLFVMHSPDNRPLFEMFRRELTVIESVWVDGLLRWARPLIGRNRFVVYDHHDYHQPRHYQGEERFLTFTPEEEARGQAILRELGIGPADWFVCFHARENGYFKRIGCSDFHLKTHDYRNCAPTNYLEAAKLVAQRGGFAVRMGTPDDSALPRPLPDRVIDYATTARDPFADIYLCAKARFFLGNSSGLVCVASIFGVRAGLANYVPYSSSPLLPGDLWLPKLIRHLPTGRLLTFKEAYALGFCSLGLVSEQLTEILARETLAFEENSSEDLVEFCQDLFDTLDGVVPSAEAREVQEYFRDHYHDQILDQGPLPLIGPRFALRYRHLILDPAT